MRAGIGIAAALCALTAASAWARVPAPWSGQLSTQLAAIEQAAALQGFSRVAGPYSGGAPRGRAQRFTVALEAGGDYRIAAVCDNDCADLDLRLYDQNGQLIEQDVSTDDHPVVTSQPAWSGPFIVEARMYDCRHPEGCYFAFNVYGRDRGAQTPTRSMPRA